MHLVPFAQCLGMVFEARGHTGQRHFSVGLHPVGLITRNDLADDVADHVFTPEASEPLERLIDLQEPIIHRNPSLVADDLVEGETLVHIGEKCPITVFTLPQGLFGAELRQGDREIVGEPFPARNHI